MVVKIAIDAFEKDWRNEGAELVVTDPDGVIFISTRSDWRLRTLRPVDQARIAQPLPGALG